MSPFADFLWCHSYIVIFKSTLWFPCCCNTLSVNTHQALLRCDDICLPQDKWCSLLILSVSVLYKILYYILYYRSLLLSRSQLKLWWQLVVVYQLSKQCTCIVSRLAFCLAIAQSGQTNLLRFTLPHFL